MFVLEEAIGQLLGLEGAVRHQIVRLISELDTPDELWRVDGARSLADWLAGRFGLSASTSRELVRVARLLRELPAVAGAFGEGRLSWDQVRWVARLADSESDGSWAENGPAFSPEQLQRRYRVEREVRPDQDAESHRQRGVRWWCDHRRRLLRLSGALTFDEGEIVTTALSRLAEQAAPDPATKLYDPFESRCADALVDICSARLADDADADRATVVVHVDAERPTGETGGGLVLSIETVRRRACDARLQVVSGEDISRAVRTVSPAMSRAVKHRDGGRCRFPGCHRRRLVEAHHIEHWADGGPTKLWNLVSLCRYHHRLVHEAGWAIEGDPGSEVKWRRPDGRYLDTGPLPLRHDIRRRYLA